MADVTATSWFPVVTLISGYVLKSITDFVQHKWNVEKERETREAKQQDQRFERRTTFQRETLLALQDVCMDLARATGRTNHLDYMENKTEKTWHKTKLPEDLDEGYRLAQARMLMLAVRVRDDTIRDLVRDFKSCSTAKTRITSSLRSTPAQRIQADGGRVVPGQQPPDKKETASSEGGANEAAKVSPPASPARNQPPPASIGSRSRFIVNSIFCDCSSRQLSTSVWYLCLGSAGNIPRPAFWRPYAPW